MAAAASAWPTRPRSLLLGDGSDGDNDGHGVHLPQIAPELARRLDQWRNGWQNDETPLQLSPDQPEVLPRFARLLADSEPSLVFLDDTSWSRAAPNR